MSVDIQYSKLWTYNVKASKIEKLPLSDLNENECSHIHGEFRIILDGRIVPHMGYFTDDDICIGYWAKEMEEMLKAFEADKLSYIIYGNDQGQPDYRFDREDDKVCLTITASRLGGNKDPDWQRIQFQYCDLKNAFYQFKKKLLQEIEQQAPDMVPFWNEKI